MKVQKKYLLLIAGFVWAVAGFNILKLGLEAYPPYISIIFIGIWDFYEVCIL